MTDSKRFHDFLTRLSREPSERTSFQENPVAAMRDAGLSDTQIVAVVSQDPGRIQAELGEEAGDAAIRVRVIVTILVEL